MSRNTARKRIPLYDLRMPRAAKQNVAAVLSAGWLSTGPMVAEFEKAIAHYTGMRYSAAVSSATAGLVTSLEAVGVRGKEVVTTPFSFVATVEAIVRCGGIPVFADIDPRTLNIDPTDVARKTGRRTACILSVDIAGYPVEYQKLGSISRAASAALISDASHSFGATYRGKSVPHFCDAAVFSFHATKNLTCGEGGMVVSRHRDLVAQVGLIARHGVTASAFQRRKNGQWAYDVTRLGFKANMSEIHAAVGLGNLEGFERNQAKRKKLAETYVANLSDLSQSLDLPPHEEHIESAWHLFIVKLNLDRIRIDRNQFIALMAREGIECGVHFVPINRFSFFRKLGLKSVHCPNSELSGERVVSLPLYPGLSQADVGFICDRIRWIAGKWKA